MTDQHAHYQILIAEDNTVSREMMSSILKTKGHTVIGAADGQTALDLASKQRFDLILIDINMSPMGGFDFARHLRQAGNSTPIIAITGENPAGLEIQASELGIQSILEKPVLPERLIHITQRTCALASQSSQAQLAAMNTHTADPQDLMLRAIEIAVKTAASGEGRAFGALIADKDGRILAEGSSAYSNEFDPLSFAEALAIRKACDTLKTQNLSECTIYCSFKPTAFGEALIHHVRIPTAYYALSYDDILSHAERAEQAANPKPERPPLQTQQLCRDEARRAFSIRD